MFIFSSKLVLLVAVAQLCACGVASPKFEDYEDDAANGPADASTPCGGEAVALFTANIQPGIKATCAVAGCHLTGAGSAKLRLNGDDAEANRSVIFNYTGLAREKLTGYISSPQHGGGNQSAVLPVDKVGPWIDKEAECTKA